MTPREHISKEEREARSIQVVLCTTGRRITRSLCLLLSVSQQQKPFLFVHLPPSSLGTDGGKRLNHDHPFHSKREPLSIRTRHPILKSCCCCCCCCCLLPLIHSDCSPLSFRFLFFAQLFLKTRVWTGEKNRKVNGGRQGQKERKENIDRERVKKEQERRAKQQRRTRIAMNKRKKKKSLSDLFLLLPSQQSPSLLFSSLLFLLSLLFIQTHSHTNNTLSLSTSCHQTTSFAFPLPSSRQSRFCLLLTCFPLSLILILHRIHFLCGPFAGKSTNPPVSFSLSFRQKRIFVCVCVV